ncbi:MAG TPA: DUF3592 domain-containing protein [Mycobacteriales bacterium]|jgi:hypothetical protein
MWVLWWPIATAAAVTAGATLAGRLILGGKRARLARGEAVTLGVHLRGSGGPYPDAWQSGSIRGGESPLRFRPWHRLSAPVPLYGLTLVKRELATVPNAGPLAALRLRDPNGFVVEVATTEDYADLVEELLREPAEARLTTTRERPPWWVTGLAALALLWLGAWAYLWNAGDIVSARVLSNDDAYCAVEWSGPHRTHHASVDCGGERPGDRRDVLALPAPFADEAADPVSTPWVVGVVGALGFVPLAGWGVLRVRRRRAEPSFPAPPGPAVVAEEPPPRIAAWELSWSAIAETARLREVTERWRDVPRPGRWERLRSTPARRVLLDALASAGIALVAPAFAVMVNVPSLDRALSPLPTEPADATVVHVETYVPFVPDEVVVAYDVAGRRVEATVPAMDEHEEGDTVAVRYDPGDPDSARLVADDGTRRGVTVVAVVAALTAAFVAFCVVRAVVALRRLRRLRRLPPAILRYAILRNPVGGLDMVLFDEGTDPRASVVVPLGERIPADVPVTGTAEVRGEPADGRRVVLTVGGHELSPEGAALGYDAESLAALVNGDAPR